MRRFDVNISILFTEQPLLRRPAAAAVAGFEAVELWWPFPEPEPPPRDVDELVDSIGSAGLTLACLNFDGGDFAVGQRGLVSDPGLAARFRRNVPVAIEIARRLDCRVLNALYGNSPAPGTVERSRAIATGNLAFAARSVRAIGARVVVEALNPAEYPAYGLHSVDEAADIAARVRAETGEDVALLFDIYHVARGGDDVCAAFRRHAPRVAHVQVADSPSRGAPGTGTLDLPHILEEIEASGYRGWFGLEYKNALGATAENAFSWLAGNDDALHWGTGKGTRQY